ncbi:MAG: hypothetical protein OQK12_14595 [Motiliproteus sp.]|nr:hypothetical protein [Motiliproteus sp.]
MSPIDNSPKHQHMIENKGPESYWVHRFSGSGSAMGNRFSRIVFFAHNKQEAERYVKEMENSAELR